MRIFDMEKEFTCDIISRGGTALFTARCEEFKQLEYQEKAAEILRSITSTDLLLSVVTDLSVEHRSYLHRELTQ